jgi:hypothetical protein
VSASSPWVAYVEPLRCTRERVRLLSACFTSLIANDGDSVRVATLARLIVADALRERDAGVLEVRNRFLGGWSPSGEAHPNVACVNAANRGRGDDEAAARYSFHPPSIRTKRASDAPIAKPTRTAATTTTEFNDLLTLPLDSVYGYALY